MYSTDHSRNCCKFSLQKFLFQEVSNLTSPFQQDVAVYLYIPQNTCRLYFFQFVQFRTCLKYLSLVVQFKYRSIATFAHMRITKDFDWITCGMKISMRNGIKRSKVTLALDVKRLRSGDLVSLLYFIKKTSNLFKENASLKYHQELLETYVKLCLVQPTVYP